MEILKLTYIGHNFNTEESMKKFCGQQKKIWVVDRKIFFFHVIDNTDRVIVRCIKIQKCQRVPVLVYIQFCKSKCKQYMGSQKNNWFKILSLFFFHKIDTNIVPIFPQFGNENFSSNF